MAKLWTANKTWQGNTTPVAGTKYLVGAASGKCSYQTFSAGQTKRCLVSNGANGNVAYQNVTMPLPDMVGTGDIIAKDKILFFNIPVDDISRAEGWSGEGDTFLLSADSVNHRYIFTDTGNGAFLSGAEVVFRSDLTNNQLDDWNTNIKPVVQSWKKIEVWEDSSTGWRKRCSVNISKWTQYTEQSRFSLRGDYTLTTYVDSGHQSNRNLRVVIFK